MHSNRMHTDCLCIDHSAHIWGWEVNDLSFLWRGGVQEGGVVVVSGLGGGRLMTFPSCGGRGGRSMTFPSWGT